MSGTQEKTTEEKSSDAFFESFASLNYNAGQKTAEIYTEWAEQYEPVLLDALQVLTHPPKTAKILSAHLPDKDCRIIDVGAGTGLVGEALHKLGYTNIDAIDGSRGMLNIAAKKGVYKQLFEEIIGSDSIKSVPQGSYDALVSSGAFYLGHLGPSEVKPMADIVRSGGIFCIAFWKGCLEYEYLKDMEPTMDRLESDGVWRKLDSGTIENYFQDGPGAYYVYKKL